MFAFLKNFKLACQVGKAYKEVKKFLEENSDKAEEIKKGIDYIKKGLDIIVANVPAVAELFALVWSLLGNLVKKKEA